jgi:gamma-glutamyltranspeptidase/glutathione hydrolase
MVAAAHPAATRVGLQILQQGGNAVDAAVACALALAVVEPYGSGLGGGGFFLVLDAAEGDVRALDARETAPRRAHRDMYLRDGKADPELSRYGPLSVAVPGLVAGLVELHESEGSLPWRELVQPAIELAVEGFPVSPMLARRIASKSQRFNYAAQSIFMPGGQVPQPGHMLVQKDLAGTLRALAAHGAAGFYEGKTGALLARAAQLDPRDLTDFEPRWREPIRGEYRGHEVFSMPPPSSGGVHLVQMLEFLAGFDLASAGHGGARVTHLLAEAMKFAYADRSLYLGDPDFVHVPVDMLLNPARIDSLRALVTLDRAYPVEDIIGVEIQAPESPETTHLSVVDGQGNAVAATLTINLSFGSCLVAEGTGVLLNDEMDDFSAAPGQPNAFGLVGGEANAVAPGKRPLSSMTPTIVLQDGRVRLVSGAPGGSKIITTTLQTIINVLDFEMDALQAVSVPRVHHQWYPRKLYHEPHGLSPDTAVLLEEMGHTLQERSPMCNAQLIVVRSGNGPAQWGQRSPGHGCRRRILRRGMMTQHQSACSFLTGLAFLLILQVSPAVALDSSLDYTRTIRALTAPELAGRGSGSGETRPTVELLRQQVEALDLQPAFSGEFVQTFPLKGEGWLGEALAASRASIWRHFCPDAEILPIVSWFWVPTMTTWAAWPMCRPPPCPGPVSTIPAPTTMPRE